MKVKIKEFIKKRPLLAKYARIIADDSLWNYSSKRKIRGKGNQIKIKNTSILSKCSIEIIGSNNSIEIGNSNILRNVTFFIKGDNNLIKFGDMVHFNRGGEIWIEDYNCKIEIGDKSTFEHSHLAATEPNSQIIIGEDCMFAYDIDVRTGDSHSILDAISGERINYAENVSIKDRVWVGSHTSLLKGSIVENDSIVATRSVVTKAFSERNVVLAGIPAKIVKKGVVWDRARIYQDIN